MSRLEELIAELCPDGVEYKTLGEIAIDIYRGSGIKREDLTESGFPCVRYGEIYTTYNIWFDQCVSFVDETKIKNGKYFEYGDILFAITGESVEEIAKSCAYVGHDKCLAGGDIVVLKHNQDPKYLAYALSTNEAQEQKSKGRVKSKVVHSNVPAIKAIRIPVPPLPVQQEIVRILDKYTALEAELEEKLAAELEARKKQYEYYRDALLYSDLDSNVRRISVEYKALGEVAHYSDTRIKASLVDCDTYIGVDNLLQNKKGKVPSSCVPTEGNLIEYKSGDVLIGNIRPYLKKIWFANNSGGTNGDVLTIRINDRERQKLLPRYLYHVLASDKFFDYMTQNSKGAKMPRGDKQAVMKYQVPIPPLNEQEHIVAILDRFDILVNDITQGLPAEISARRKQYEYYRDKLLTFKEKIS